MRFTERPPNLDQIDRNLRDRERRVTAAARVVIPAKTREAQQRQRTNMRAAGLGGLTNAVKSKSGAGKDLRGNDNAYGVIYADNGDESRAGQALQAYSQGTTIQPVRGNWLWFQTDAIRRVAKIPGDTRRGRMTPERYRRQGSPLGKLEFALLSPRLAKLYVEVADISVKTGLASRPGKRMSRTKVRSKRVTIFWGIKKTSRAQRYDPQATVQQAFREIPAEIAAEIAAAVSS
jgi:hypothetical protein